MTITTLSLFSARKSPSLMKTLYSLTFRGYSEMRYQLHGVVSDKFAKQYKIIIAKTNNKIVGWALVFPVWYEIVQNTPYNAYFYVSRAYRRKGIGTILYREAKKICDRKKISMICFPHDQVSTSFFKRNETKI